MSYRVLVTSLLMISMIDRYRTQFAEEDIELILPEITGQTISEERLCGMIADVDGVLAGDDPFTAQALEKGRQGRLKALVRVGIGYDSVDVQAAQRLGIAFSNTPGVFNDEVADLAVGYLLLLARKLHVVDNAVRSGEWMKFRGSSLRGKIAGIIGVGGIGKAIAQRVCAFGMETLGYHTHPLDQKFCQDTGMTQVSLDDLLRRSDYIFLSCSFKPENYHLLNEKTFAMMKDGVQIINVARGALIDEDALIDALEDGKVAGAGLDVFESEPIDEGHPLCSYDQVVLGAHNGSNTTEGVLRVNQAAITILLDFLKRGA